MFFIGLWAPNTAVRGKIFELFSKLCFYLAKNLAILE